MKQKIKAWLFADEIAELQRITDEMSDLYDEVKNIDHRVDDVESQIEDCVEDRDFRDVEDRVSSLEELEEKIDELQRQDEVKIETEVRKALISIAKNKNV